MSHIRENEHLELPRLSLGCRAAQKQQTIQKLVEILLFLGLSALVRTVQAQGRRMQDEGVRGATALERSAITGQSGAWRNTLGNRREFDKRASGRFSTATFDLIEKIAPMRWRRIDPSDELKGQKRIGSTVLQSALESDAETFWQRPERHIGQHRGLKSNAPIVGKAREKAPLCGAFIDSPGIKAPVLWRRQGMRLLSKRSLLV